MTPHQIRNVGGWIIGLGCIWILKGCEHMGWIAPTEANDLLTGGGFMLASIAWSHTRE